MQKIECTHITNTFPRHVAMVSAWTIHWQAQQLLHICLKIILNLNFWTVVGDIGQDTTDTSGFGVPTMDFDEKVILWATLTLRCWRVWECPESGIFNTYSARSLDLAGRYAAKFAPRARKTSEKVGMFAFWANRRCVRPYYWGGSSWTLGWKLVRILEEIRTMPCY